MKPNTQPNTVRLTLRGSEILLALSKRHPDYARSKLIEMSLEQFVNSQAELTDTELDETAKISEFLTSWANSLENRSADNPKAAKDTRGTRMVVAFLGRILARAIRLKQLKS